MATAWVRLYPNLKIEGMWAQRRTGIYGSRGSLASRQFEQEHVTNIGITNGSRSSISIATSNIDILSRKSYFH